MINLKNIIKELKKCDAKNIIKCNVSNKLLITDYMIICTGDSNIHIKYIYKKIYKKFKKYIINRNIELDKLLEWIILDLDNIIIHIMQEHTRITYNLEEIWK